MLSTKSEITNLGNERVGRTYTGWGDFQSLKGRMRGLLIEGTQFQIKVKSINIIINHNEWGSVAFRLNFIRFENGKICFIIACISLRS